MSNFYLYSATFCLLPLLAFDMVAAKSLNRIETQPEDILVAQDSLNLLVNNSSAKFVRISQDLSAESSRTVGYVLGGRVPGDRLVVKLSEKFVYPAKKDAVVDVKYPESGKGQIVTFVEIICQQDTDEGNAYVEAGGIGSRSLLIKLEAKQTLQFAYEAFIYGVNS